MIKINLDEKLRASGHTLASFKDDYISVILSLKYQIITLSNNRYIDRFKLHQGKTQLQLSVLKSSIRNSVTIDQLFFLCYKNNVQFSQFIHSIINVSPIRNIESAKKVVKNIIFIRPELLEAICTTKTQPKALNELIYNIFDYDKFGKYKKTKRCLRDIYANLNFRVCIYCNRNYTSNYFDTNKDRPTFTLDHFHQKEDHPLFALSVFNLIPCCSVCNTTIKGSKKLEHYMNPYCKGYKFNKLAQFELDQNYKVTLRSIDKKCRGYISDFKINEIYKCHTPEVKEFVVRSQKFNKRIIETLSTITNESPNEIKKTLFGSYDNANNMSNESLSKLRHDLYKQLKI
ncbi:hypothetical protein [Vibrio splendidus]|uniref:hypothetical protein n=1 Tax=Vibrio splendidus TaxID=29497 RepID=UPI0011B81DF3|nr:hypothetical protein [Vibrio splendidus]